MYLITKVVNNNIVCSVDDKGNEIMLRGLGIGFQKKPNDMVSSSKIEMIYRSSNSEIYNKIQQLISEIPSQHLTISTTIIEYASKNLSKNLNDNLIITLTDHLNFAIERHKNNMAYKNPLLWEIKSFYPEEYQIGLYALDLVKNELSVLLSEDEASFIALHIVNAELDATMSSTFQITELIQSILHIVSNYYDISLDESSLYYARFITHLKYFGQRLFQHKTTSEDDTAFQEIISKRYPRDYECATLIRRHVEKEYHQKVSDDEMIFLTVHLRRITTS